jgi:hypothetical protein
MAALPSVWKLVANGLLLKTMTDYRKLVGALGLPPEEAEKVVPPLERLEATFRPLVAGIPMSVEPDLRFLAAEDPE